MLGLPDYRVVALERGDNGRLVIEVERRGIRRYVCSGCGRRTGRIRDAKVRASDDVPWAEHPVTLRYPLRRLWCRHCGIRTERVGFAEAHARLTRRFRQRIGLDCQSMPTSHAAVRHAVSWGTARRAERAFLEAWDRTRPTHRPRHLGVDEIQRGKGQRAPPGILPCRHGDAETRARQALAPAAALEDGARLETGRAAGAVRSESPIVQSRRPAGAARSTLDLHDATGRVEFPQRLD